MRTKTKTKEQELKLAVDLRRVMRQHLETAIAERDSGAIITYACESARLRDVVMQLEKEIVQA